jgi:hypothetical protein
MNPRQLADDMPPPSSKADASTAPSAGWAAWVRQQWRGVCVTQVETTPACDDVPGHVRVRANVHLGSLVPADVLVDATADREKVPAEWSTRLASLQSYGNGTFVFEGLLPPHAVDDRCPLIVRVRPGAAHDAFSGLGRVARTFDVRTDSGREATRGGEHGRDR